MNLISKDAADQEYESNKMENRHDVILSMGSNLGDKMMVLRKSLQQIELHSEIDIVAVSSVYETDPVGYMDQPAFYNIVVEIHTSLSPLDLLVLCQRVEKQFHRERKVRWGPRTIDIDIITYDDVHMEDEELTIPHPRMNEREFVLLPLEEIRTGKAQASKSVRPVYSNWY